MDTPDPGVYDISDYCSSDWDEDPKSLDPVIGEESTTRLPFSDWCPCQPPPFPCPPFSENPFWPDGVQQYYYMTVDSPALSGSYAPVNGTYLWRNDSDALDLISSPAGVTGGPAIVYWGPFFLSPVLNVQSTDPITGSWAFSGATGLTQLNSFSFTLDGVITTYSMALPVFSSYSFTFLAACGLPLLTPDKGGRRILTETGDWITAA